MITSRAKEHQPDSVPGRDMAHQRNALQILSDEHVSLAAVLRSLISMVERGPLDKPEQFFDVLRAMLFYIDEFPEKHHHPKESELLFPMLVKCAPELQDVIERLDQDHRHGHDNVRELQHQLLAWELLGDSRRDEFGKAAVAYVDSYLQHMKVEESQLLPVARSRLDARQQATLGEAFRANADPLATEGRQPVFDRLFTRIVMTAPAPIGLGPA